MKEQETVKDLGLIFYERGTSLNYMDPLLYHLENQDDEYIVFQRQDLEKDHEDFRKIAGAKKENFYISGVKQTPTTKSWLDFLHQCYYHHSFVSENKNKKRNITKWATQFHFDEENLLITMISVQKKLLVNNIRNQEMNIKDKKKTSKAVLNCDSKEGKEFFTFFQCYHKCMSPALLAVIFVSLIYHKNGKGLYKHFRIPKTSGDGMREIYAPNEDVKKALRLLLKPLTQALCKKKFPNQFAYLKNKSILNNACAHAPNKENSSVSQRYYWKTDIKSFFDCCTYESCEKFFKFLHDRSLNGLYSGGHVSAMADKYSHPDGFGISFRELLKKVLINPNTGGLYQGSPVSGLLSNVIIRSALAYASNILKKDDRSSVLTAYADDITISSEEKITSEHHRKYIRVLNHVFEERSLNFTLKEEKTRISRNNAVCITGVVINHEGDITTKRSNYRLLRTCLERLQRGEELSEDMTISRLEGILSFCMSIDTLQGTVKPTKKMQRLLERYHGVLIDNEIHISEKFSKIEVSYVR